MDDVTEAGVKKGSYLQGLHRAPISNDITHSGLCGALGLCSDLIRG